MSFDFHRQKGAIARGQWFSVQAAHFYEHPSGDASIPEIWGYAGQTSYAPGDTVRLHVSTTAKTFDVEIKRDGGVAEIVALIEGVSGEYQETPPKAYRSGCNWNPIVSWTIPDNARSGGYVVSFRITGRDGQAIEQQAFFIVRGGQRKSSIVLIAATATWNAYNDWGGANHYEGIDGENGDQFSPVLSMRRPWARGLIWLPEGAPRIPHHGLGANAVPRYPNFEYALAQGFGKYYAAAGWASYERHFVRWAEQNDISVDVICQTDLHRDPDCLNRYKCAAIVGHDEYWSRDMREHLDAWVEKGGNVARFGANYFWQIRLEGDLSTQVCYKYCAEDADPLRGSDQAHLITTSWEHPLVNFPGASTMGLNGTHGVYVGVGGLMPRGQTGFTVYRPEHWVFEGADVYFGDMLGADAGIYGYEVDGVDFSFVEGRPVPTHSDGAPQSLKILAMGPAALVEEDHSHPGTNLYAGPADAEFVAATRHGEVTPKTVEQVRYGAGMMAIFQRGEGEVFNAASCEWVMGLVRRDVSTERITRNVLLRFSGQT